MEKEKELIQTTASELFSLLGLSLDFTLETEEDMASITLETEEGGIIIGYHGEILEALQLVLSLCVSKRLGRFLRVSIEVGDYKKNREEYIRGLAMRTKEKVLQENREYSLPSLKAWERRIIHLLFQDDKEVVSESVGKGRERTLVVRPRE